MCMFTRTNVQHTTVQFSTGDRRFQVEKERPRPNSLRTRGKQWNVQQNGILNRFVSQRKAIILRAYVGIKGNRIICTSFLLQCGLCPLICDTLTPIGGVAVN